MTHVIHQKTWRGRLEHVFGKLGQCFIAGNDSARWKCLLIVRSSNVELDFPEGGARLCEVFLSPSSQIGI